MMRQTELTKDVGEMTVIRVTAKVSSTLMSVTNESSQRYGQRDIRLNEKIPYVFTLSSYIQ